MKNVLLFTGVIGSLLIITGCQSYEPTDAAMAYSENHEVIDEEEKNELLDVSDEIFFTSDRSNQTAEATSTVIPDRQDYLNLPEGRYRIYGQGGGNVEVYDANDNLLVGDYVGRGFAPSLTVDLKEDFTVKVDGFYDLFVEPTDTKMQTELTSGIWEVGLDVPAGEYEVTAQNGMGYLTIFDPEQESQVYEIIGNKYSPTKSKITLEEGQKVRVTGVAKLVLNEMKE
ncbi:hypothetical protein E3U55_14500 [Filobacillus milosensis]|uniref:Lipoprotein n=1 Tax=Filobacillus milosensis TaxID=94137 RepID=A0A4Y8IGG0_9BACI|nr:hypothetical protein [Filobacillus milosensis]TFB14121.1 hypothetical protein E3U55_14500 [Filobacillus milosensis]